MVLIKLHAFAYRCLMLKQCKFKRMYLNKYKVKQNVVKYYSKIRMNMALGNGKLEHTKRWFSTHKKHINYNNERKIRMQWFIQYK